MFFFPVQIRPFVVFNLAGISKFIYEGKNQMNSVSSSKMTSSCRWPIPLSAVIKYSSSQDLLRKRQLTNRYLRGIYPTIVLKLPCQCKKLVFLLSTHSLVIFFFRYQKLLRTHNKLRSLISNT